jgi:hypothetical protein
VTFPGVLSAGVLLVSSGVLSAPGVLLVRRRLPPRPGCYQTEAATALPPGSRDRIRIGIFPGRTVAAAFLGGLPLVAAAACRARAPRGQVGQLVAAALGDRDDMVALEAGVPVAAVRAAAAGALHGDAAVADVLGIGVHRCVSAALLGGVLPRHERSLRAEQPACAAPLDDLLKRSLYRPLELGSAEVDVHGEGDRLP